MPALFPATYAQIDIWADFPPDTDPSCPPCRTEDCYRGTVVHIVSDQTFFDAALRNSIDANKGDLMAVADAFENTPFYVVFNTGDAVRDFAAALDAARNIVGPDIHRVDTQPFSVHLFIEYTREYHMVSSHEHPGYMTLRRVERLKTQKESPVS